MFHLFDEYIEEITCICRVKSIWNISAFRAILLDEDEIIEGIGLPKVFILAH
jgi:hypothetical protein